MSNKTKHGVCRLVIFAVLLCCLPATAQTYVPDDQIVYLSGTGSDDTVDWEFYCTAGRNSGYWTTIPVPSNWELQGFGRYNYGHDRPKADEQGQYRTSFHIPTDWQQRRVLIVFEGVMTDTEVRINGQSAGPKHLGGFYQFEYDITDLVQFGKDNLLEVTASKVSSNQSVENAERQGDYWVFGGIYRPVYLKSRPQEYIDWTAINARADGSFYIDVHLNHIRNTDTVTVQIYDPSGKSVGQSMEETISAGQTKAVLQSSIPSPKTWTAETPYLYRAVIRLQHGQTARHQISERFGFRTIEVRQGDGFYLNGQKIRLKGVNRHSFWPDTGRALNRQICYDDVRLIKSMNMNAVRMSHYPPDKAFLEACDELGLCVINELAGWHDAYDTTVGKRLVGQMVRRDVNHPSILFWANGNEGGHNFDLVDEYAVYDPQNRVVLHPTPTWDSPSVFNGVDTAHYCDYDDHVRRLTQSNAIYVPTEFLHALYDGGAGAGLNDYWKAILDSPRGAGGFIWALVDEGVVRTDRQGRIDNDGNHAPDGIVGPYREKEGSYYTVKDIWSPVQIPLESIDAAFDGVVPVENHYAFTNLNQCRFEWQWVDFPQLWDTASGRRVRHRGEVKGPDVAPGKRGQLRVSVPTDWRQRNALYLTAFDPTGQELFTWSWAIQQPSDYRKAAVDIGDGRVRAVEHDQTLNVWSGDVNVQFDLTDGRLKGVRHRGQLFSLANGPRFVPAGMFTDYFEIAAVSAGSEERPNVAAHVADGNMMTRWSSRGDGAWVVLDLGQSKSFSEVQIVWQRGHQRRFRFDIAVSKDNRNWTTVFSGQSSGTTAQAEPYEVGQVTGRYVRVTGKGNSENEWTSIHQIQIHAEAETPVKVTHGADEHHYVVRVNHGDNARFQWTLYPSGWLKLDYTVQISGEFDFLGVSFDYPEEHVLSKRFLGDGPYRVWKNRMRGTRLDVHENLYNDPVPGQTWAVPEFKGYFANMNWLVLNTRQGKITMMTDTPDLFLRLFTPHFGPNPENAVAAMPDGNISFLHTISAIGTKFRRADRLGPESRRTSIDQTLSGTLYYHFSQPTALPSRPKKPQVLLIGDSISIGYTQPTATLLEKKANVARIDGNARNTGYGQENIDRWLNDVQWDVIHFNWGLWDIAYRIPDPQRIRSDKNRGILTTSPEDYEINLRKLVQRLRQTNAKLIWASTTPVPDNEPGRFKGDEIKYNTIASKVMAEYGIYINDLHAHVLPSISDYQLPDGNVHLTPEGYRFLAEQVARSINSVISEIIQ